MKAAATYARVSTAEQAREGTSLVSQADACRKFAQEHGYTVTTEIQEDISGARLARPGLDQIRDMAQRGEVNAIIVFDPDRLSRKLAYTTLLMEEFERNRTELLFVNAPNDATDEGRMLLQMRGMFAEYERAKIMERSRRGKEQKVRQGHIIGNRVAPYGYAKGGGKLTPIESELVWVRQMYDWVVSDRLSLRQIVKRLQAAGVPTKQGASGWNASTVRNILLNPLYTGKWYYNRQKSVVPRTPRKERRYQDKTSSQLRPEEEWIVVNIPPVVSDEAYEKIRDHLKQHKAIAPDGGKHRHLFRGLIKCAYCGYKMYGHAKTSGTRFYECAGRGFLRRHVPDAERCHCPSVNAGTLEKKIWGEVIKQVSNLTRIEKGIRVRECALQDARQRDDEELTAFSMAEQSLKQEANKLIDLHLSEILDKIALQERMTFIKQKQVAIQQAKHEVIERISRREQVKVPTEALEKLWSKLRHDSDRFTFEDMQEFLRALDTKITWDGKQARVEWLLTEAVLTITGRYSNDVPGTEVYSRQS